MSRASEQVRLWAKKARDATKRRDTWIRKMREEDGASLREIAEEAELSHSAIARILGRR